MKPGLTGLMASPMTSVPLEYGHGLCGTAGGRLRPAPGRRDQAAIIRRQSQTIRDLVNDLNLTMRLDCQMQALRKTKLDLAPFLRQTAADFLNSGLAEGSPWRWTCRTSPCPAWKPMSFSFAGPSTTCSSTASGTPPRGCHPPGGPGRQARHACSGWKTPPRCPCPTTVPGGGRWPSPRNRVKIGGPDRRGPRRASHPFSRGTFLCQLRLPMRPS